MMKSKNQNNKKRRSTVLKKIVGQEVAPGCIVVSLSNKNEKGNDLPPKPPKFNPASGQYIQIFNLSNNKMSSS